MAKMSEKDKKNWDALYQYFKKDVMKYDETMVVPRYAVQRLKSMAYGEFMHNKNNEKKRIYSYGIILYTFKYKKKTIDRYILRTQFQNEQHKINGILKIVEGSINDVVIALKNKKKQREETKTVDVVVKKETEKAQYKSSKNKKRRKEDLW